MEVGNFDQAELDKTIARLADSARSYIKTLDESEQGTRIRMMYVEAIMNALEAVITNVHLLPLLIAQAQDHGRRIAHEEQLRHIASISGTEHLKSMPQGETVFHSVQVDRARARRLVEDPVAVAGAIAATQDETVLPKTNLIKSKTAVLNEAAEKMGMTGKVFELSGTTMSISGHVPIDQAHADATDEIAAEATRKKPPIITTAVGAIDLLRDDKGEVTAMRLRPGLDEEELKRVKSQLDGFKGLSSSNGETVEFIDGVRVHRLKIESKDFEAHKDGIKTNEVRAADREYKVGDILWLREYVTTEDHFTGRVLWRKVTHIQTVTNVLTVMGLWPCMLVLSTVEAESLTD